MDMFAEVMFFLCMSQVDKFYYEPRLGRIPKIVLPICVRRYRSDLVFTPTVC
eukprot:COSAG02_NODE_46741_length_346_cov_1.044534_1_plen_52_part_00